MRRVRVIFMGTPLFAVPSLKAIVDAGFEVRAVVTQADKPRGRGLAPLPSAVKEEALKYGIEVMEPLRASHPGFIDRLKTLTPDFIAVVAYGKILPQAILEIPKKGCVNLHASLLPKYRGAAPTMDRSLTVPQTASLPISPPGKKMGLTTCVSVVNASRLSPRSNTAASANAARQGLSNSRANSRASSCDRRPPAPCAS